MHVLIDYNAKCSLSGLNFQYLNKDEVLKLSVKEITKSQVFDRLLNPIQGGLYDLALGPLDKNDICLTCNMDYFQCPGHFGHVNLALPVYNPVFFKELIKLLRASCLSCHHLRTSRLEKDYFMAKMKLISHGLIEKLSLVTDLYSRVVNNCGEKEARELSFKHEFDNLIKSIMKNAYENMNETAWPSKNVVKAKQEALKEFLDIKLKSGTGLKNMCPNCSIPLRELRAEHHSKLFYAKGISSRQLKKNKEVKLINERQITPSDDEDADISDQVVNGIDRLDIQLNSDSEGNKENGENDDEEADGVVSEKNGLGAGGKMYKKNINKSTDNDMIDEDEQLLENLTGQAYLTPVECRKHLYSLVENEKAVVELILGRTNQTNPDMNQADLFFFDTIAVPPSKFRPISQFKEQKFENAQTAQLSKLLQQNLALKEILIEIISLANEGGATVSNNNKKYNNVSADQPKETQQNAEQTLNMINMANKIAKKSPSLHEKLQAAWLQLQQFTNNLYDSDLDKLNAEAAGGLKQLLEKKEGLFRKHMMGKRVNYAGRSVISPDVYIGTDEIGIPEVFAKKLTYPQPVNSANFWEMKQLVLNGPDHYPGASLVEYGNGNTVRLKGKDYESRLAIAKQLLTPESSIDSNLDIKIVHRHLKNGDVLLFNRQPTLHRPSVQAHKARVLPGEKTLRMHYSNCKAYNADFDGDEMNAHLPQNEMARAEALFLMLSDEHYLVPKDGTPLGGLIHDHVVSGVALTMRDRFFDRSDYQHLVYNSFNTVRNNIKLLPPAILKPKSLWTGKQVISTLLINLLPKEKGALNLESKSKISDKIWYRENKARLPNWNPLCSATYSPDLMTEAYVLIRNGHLLSGVLDKAHYGSSSFSLVHCCYELYGGSISGQLLTSLGRLFTSFLQLRGFTLGVEDILLQPNMNKSMSKIIKKAKKCGFNVLSQVFNVANMDKREEELLNQYQSAHLNPDESYLKEIDLAYKGGVDTFQNSLTNLCFPNGLIKKFPQNNLQLMIQSGAKGSSVNSMQMSCLLGQQELEGRRPRLMVNGNTLPSFLPYDPSPISGGFITNSFMTGLTPQEYFFHCMAGREGLVDTAVKTSRSGYLQRCLIKHLEGIMVNYDLTVRDSDNSIIQFQYGEDSLAVDKIPFLQEKQFPFLIDNYSILMANKPELDQINRICHHQTIFKKIEKIKEWKLTYDTFFKSTLSNRTANLNTQDLNGIGMRWSPFLNFSKLQSNENHHLKHKKFEDRVAYVVNEWKSMPEEEKKIYKKGKFKRRLPITVFHNPDRYLGAISEKLQECMDTYIKKNAQRFIDVNDSSLNSFNLTSDQFTQMIYLKTLKSCIMPGDSVGILAAQSIGEPSTQMTLNTFHFAGRGDMNVTLGIPRLREILMVASSNIKTPSMQVPVYANKIVEAEKIKTHFTRTLLWDCFHKIDIEQTLKLNYGTQRVWLTKVRFEFMPQEELKLKLDIPIRLWDILVYYEEKFVKNLCTAIGKKHHQIQSSSLLHASTIRDASLSKKSAANDSGAQEDNDIDEQDMGEVANDAADMGESSGEKLVNNMNDELEYVGEEQEKKEIDEKSENEDDDTTNEEDEEKSEDDDVEKQSKSVKASATVDIKKKSTKQKEKDHVNKILNLDGMIADYKYDSEHLQWCEITLKLSAHHPRLDLYSIIQKEAKHSYISKVDGIKRCFLNESTLPQDNGCYKLITEGININEVIKHSNVLNASKLYLNDIHLMASKFGIEAAYRVIINEIKQVFGAYGINVDYRHLSLIADYMTFEGVYKPFNRIGIRTNGSPLQKMTFETCLQFFKDAYLSGQADNLTSPSSCIVTGRMVHSGTGSFDLLTRLI